MVFELKFEPPTSSSKVLSQLNAFQMHEALTDWSIKLESSEHPLLYLREVDHQRRELTSALSKEFGVSLTEGDVLLDVPPGGRDQVDNIFVDIGNKEVPLDNLSAMGGAVQATFRDWTRTARIFMSSEAFERCIRRGHDRVGLQNKTSDVLARLLPFRPAPLPQWIP
jgi:hypothetical protein